MKLEGWLPRLLAAIAVLTLVSGVVQLVAPSFVLSLVGGEATAASRHFFAIVGMFMALFGGMLLQALLRREGRSIVLLWCGLQKLGAAAAVGLGVSSGVFAPLALAVAGFDFLSGVLIFVHRHRLGGAS